MDKIQKTELGTIKKVTVEKMNFIYMEVSNDLETQKKSWPEFEARFPSLTGRKMFGLDYDQKKTYRLCSLVLDSDVNERFGLEQFTFEGGPYIRLRLKFNSLELFEKISPAYEYLFRQYEKEINWSRPLIEHYKAKNILDIMIPINN